MTQFFAVNHNRILMQILILATTCWLNPVTRLWSIIAERSR